MFTVKMEGIDVMEHVLSAYKKLNDHLTWKNTLCYAGIGTLAYTVYSFGIKPYLSPLRKIPGPAYNPIFGNVREAMVGEAMQSSVGWVKKYGGIVRFYHLFGRERVLVADPKALKEIFLTNVGDYARVPGIISRLTETGIFITSGEVHHSQRRLMNPIFNHEHIESYLAIFEEKSTAMVNIWHKQIRGKHGLGTGSAVSVQNDLMRMTLDVIGKVVFGYEFNSLHDASSAVNSAFRVVTSQPAISITQLIPFYSKFPTAKNRELQNSLDLIDSIIYRIIKQKRQLLADDKDCKFANADFLGKLLLARDEQTGKGLSDKELRDQVMSLLLAGHETTSVTMAWILLLLAQNQDVQEKLRQEVTQHFPDSGPLTWNDLDQMTYLDSIIKEAQRLYPAAPSVYRRTIRDVTLQGYFLPKGTLIAYHVGAMMRNPAIWKDPETFNPDRFAKGAKDIDLYTYLPFITGPHKCLGHLFAKMEMKAVISRLVKEFEFKVPKNATFTRKLRVTLKPNPALFLMVKKASQI